MKLSRAQKILLATGATLVAGAVFFSSRALAVESKTTVSHDRDNGTLVTGNDTVYDYKYLRGIWYSRKKGASSWINLKKSLAPKKYAEVEGRLRKYI
jgi:hypothetical protein